MANKKVVKNRPVGIGIAWKITAMVILITTSALLISGGSFILYERHSMEEHTKNEMSILADVIANNNSASIIFNDKTSATKDLSSLEPMPQIEAASIYKADGSIFASFRKKSGSFYPPEVAPESGTQLANQQMLITHPITLDNEKIGTIHLIISMKGTHLAARRSAAIVGIVILLTLIAAMALAFRLQKIVSQPIVELAETAHNISKSSDYSVRVKKQSNDEQGMLADAFNEMLVQVEQRDAKLQKHKEELEKEVENRTKELRAAKEMAENATQLKNKFVALVSHDLRSPLGNITNLLGLLKEDGTQQEGKDKQESIVKATQDMAEGLMNMIDKLLDISRLQTGKIELDKEFLNIHKLADYQLTQLHQVAAAKGVSIKNMLDEATQILADQTLIGEVINNMVSNAIKFCNEGDVVTLSILQNTNGIATIAIKDSGVGIDSSKIDKLFKHEVKTSTRGTAGEKGTGLGLPYCMDIMQAHGGNITVESNQGHGSCFYIHMPKKKKIILLVEDQELQRRIAKAILQKLDVEIVEAEDGLQAMQKLKTAKPNLVISDVQMPNLDGIGLLQNIRSSSKTENLPVILCSSKQTYNGMEDEKNISRWAKQKGADDFLAKPLIEKDLLESIKKLLPEVVEKSQLS